jgi:bifunctional non-homologous end joining protein LigD
MIVKQTTLYFRQESSDKIYTATLEEQNGGYFVNFAFGRRGATQQTGTKTPTPVNLDAAGRIFDKLVNEKMAKGYTVGEDGMPYTHSPKAEQVSGILPQLCNPIEREEVERFIKNPEWWMQQKHDGQRMLIQKKDGVITGINRKGLTVALPKPLIDHAAAVAGDFVIDGEAIGNKLIAFDLLLQYGEDIRTKSYLERHLFLMNMLSVPPGRSVRLCTTSCTDPEKKKMFEMLERQGAEGVVFKRIDQPYSAGRPASGGDWLKFKFVNTGSFVVSRINAKRSVSLVLMENGVARNSGNVTVPANHDIPPVGAVVEVRYLYAFQQSGHIYQPVYLGVRDDIAHDECTVDQLKYKPEAAA